MSDLIDDLKEKAEDLISKVDKGGQVRSTIDSIRRQIAEADRKRRIKQVQSDLAKLRAQIDQATMDLGVQVLSLYATGKLNNAELAALCKHITEMKAEISPLEQELAKLQPPAPVPTMGAPCPVCGKPLLQGADFCPYCGAKVAKPAAPTPQFCMHCGAALRPTAKFCPACGQSVMVS